MDIISNSEEETKIFAEKFAPKLKLGGIIALYGDLGSGKTTFTRYLAKVLGVKERITSPTFVIEKRYKIKAKGRKQKEEGKMKELIHIDCYRMDEDSVDRHYLDETFNQANTVIVVEWPEKIEKHLPATTKRIYFEYLDQSIRKIAC